MKPFPFGHATHPQWRMAAGLVIAQLRAQMALPQNAQAPTLGLAYFTDHYADEAQALLDHLRQELPQITSWAGTVGVGIASNNVEYFDEPALAVMLCELPADSYRVFSGVSPMAASAEFSPHAALVHADGHTPDLPELLGELAQRTASNYLFGGLASSRQSFPQMAWQAEQAVGAHAGVFNGGFSGVAFAQEVSLISRVTQGCEPIRLADAASGKKAQPHRITKSDRNVVLELDGEAALDVLLDELGITLDEPKTSLLRLRQTLVGLTDAASESGDKARSVPTMYGRFGTDTRVRHLIGLDPLRRGVAVADIVPPDGQLTFCQRDREAARRDLMRICAEIREELEPVELSADNLSARHDHGNGDGNSNRGATDLIAKTQGNVPGSSPFSSENGAKTILGAIYISCAGRGGPHFGGDSAELQILRHALGDARGLLRRRRNRVSAFVWLHGCAHGVDQQLIHHQLGNTCPLAPHRQKTKKSKSESLATICSNITARKSFTPPKKFKAPTSGRRLI
jgi:small ligand-binding sensory domain FIST